MDATQHLEALAAMYQSGITAVSNEAAQIRNRIDGDLEMLTQLTGEPERPPLLDVPIEEPPPYVPPPKTSSYNALIPDTPLVDAPGGSSISSSSLAFDDAPLWQS